MPTNGEDKKKDTTHNTLPLNLHQNMSYKYMSMKK